MNHDRIQETPAADRLPVYFWPDALPSRSDATPAAPDVFIIAVGTDDGQQRGRARQHIREAVRAAVGKLLDIDPAAIAISATNGSAPHIVLDRAGPHGVGRTVGLDMSHAIGDSIGHNIGHTIGPTIGLSISHESGLSLAAINLRGAVGVDLMREQEIADWEIVARDYLGPETAQALAATAVAHRASAFASAWTAREASLKCCGLALQEWTPSALPCRPLTVILPKSYFGSVSVPLVDIKLAITLLQD